MNRIRIHRASPPIPDASTAKASQENPRSHAARPDSTRTCTYPFTTGSGATYMNFCVTVNGNLANFQSPAGVEMLDQDGAVEGYGLCDNTLDVAYYDYEYEDSGNWNAPITVTNTATLLKIERTTSDGAWTLTQTFSKVNGTTPSAKLVMALKNNSGVAKEAILFRFAGFVGDNAAANANFNENYDGTVSSAWGYIPDGSDQTSGTLNGMMLQNVGTPVPATVFPLVEGYPIDTETGPDPCDPTLNYSGTVTNGQGSGVLLYVEELGKGKTGTATARYFSF